MSKWISTGLGATLVLLAGAAQGDALRCGTELAHTGDSSYEVRSMCGEPAQVDRHVEERRVVASCRGDERSCARAGSVKKDIVVERWTYDFGRRSFMQHLTFEDGRLIEIRRGDYGRRDN